MNNSLAGQPVCLVTGAQGYLGSRVKALFQQRGWRVVELTRQPQPGSQAVAFQLGGEVAPAALTGAKALVHCAYDFTPLSWEQIRAVNVEGSAKLFTAVMEAKVERLVHISSMSAFEGCRSCYGRAKLETERLARQRGAFIIRPGLIYGDRPAGIFGRLVRQAESSRLLLLPGGSQIQYLIHDEDLASLVFRCATGEVSWSGPPVTIAHERPWTFREILREIARAKGKRISLVPVPWRLAWTGIKCAELCGLRLDFRSDSLVSLMHQNPNPSFAEQGELGVVCRPFQWPPQAGPGTGLPAQES